MGRFGNSWETVKQSWGVLKKDKELLLFPVLSGIAALAILASFIWPTYTNGLLERAVEQEDPNAQQTLALLYLLMYFILSFITIYFNAALTSAALERLRGGDPNVWTGLRGANQRLGKILLWSLFAATVSLLIQMIEAAARRANNVVGHIVARLLGVAWTLLIFFVIPVIVVENKGVFAGLKRSGQLFKQRWGESLVGEYGIGLVFGLLGAGVMLVTVVLLNAVGGLGAGTEGGLSVAVTAASLTVLVVGIAAFLLVLVVGLALGVVYKAALYLFAAGGEPPQGFSPQLVEKAYRPEKVPASTRF